MKFSPIRAAAALTLALALAACGDKTSREDLNARIAELEDENDLLKQQLEDARFQAEEAAIAAERARTPAPAPYPPAYPPAFSFDSGERDDIASDPAATPPEAAAPRPDRASAAAAAAAEAAETARQALGIKERPRPPLAAGDR